MRRLLVLTIILASANAHAASLRSMTTLHGPNVYVRDLFDDAGLEADRVLGPGPAPGGRIIVEAAQLNAIARQYNVDWRSASRADRAVLEWPGRPMKKEDALAAVRVAVTAAGVADDIDIEMPGFTPPTVPIDAGAVPTVSQLDYDRSTGRFTAALTITGEGMDPIDTRVSGEVVEMLDAPVASTRLLPETVLRPQDVHMARIRTALLRNDVARSLGQVVGMQLRRPLAAGQPLDLADLMRPPLVQRGATVRIELSVDGLSVTGEAVALDAGAQGDRVRVQNLTSKAFMFAEVTGPGWVTVRPDAGAALPMVPARYNNRDNE
jgi:flagella basal body P-ring formation protein FlgA